MKKIVLASGLLVLMLWGGGMLPALVNALALGLLALAACLGLGALALGLLWKVPFPASRPAAAPPPAAWGDDAVLAVPVLCYRPNGDIDYVLGELLPHPAP